MFKMRFGWGPKDGAEGMNKNIELIKTVRSVVATTDLTVLINSIFLFIPSAPSFGPQPKRILNILKPSFKYFSASIFRSFIGWLYNFEAYTDSCIDSYTDSSTVR